MFPARAGMNRRTVPTPDAPMTMFPARAGMNRPHGGLLIKRDVPRTCGDEPNRSYYCGGGYVPRTCGDEPVM